MNPVVVHGIAGSPYLRAALLALTEKGVPWRLAHMQPGESKSPGYLARMPFGRISVVEHDGFILYETQAVMRWADEAFGPRTLQPADPRMAARMNQVMGVTDWYVFRSWSAPIGFERVIKPMFSPLPSDEAAIAAALPLARTAAEVLDDLLGDQPYFCGEALTLADLHLAPHMEFFAMTPEGQGMLDGTRLPAWLKRMAARESWQATAIETLRAAA